MYTAFPRALLVCLIVSFCCSGLSAQIFVDSTGSNGFGDLPHPLAKSRFSNVDHEYNLFVRSTGTDTVRGVGIYNYLNAGTNEKHGIWNHIEQAQGSDGLTFGLRNVVSHGGDADAYGLYNDLSNTSESRGRLFGTYSLVDDRGARALGKLYANFYGETIHRRKRNAYGSYLLVRSQTMDAGKTSYGQYIDIRGNGTAERFGVYANINGGQGYAGYFVGDVHINGTLTQASDERLKENIVKLDGALATVLALKPHTYNYIPSDEMGFGEDRRIHYGFLAQEVAKVLPDLVTDVKHGYHLDEGKMAMEAETVDELGFPNDIKGVAAGAKSGSESTDEAVATRDIHAVRYLDMIALLVGAVQEQEQQMKQYNTEFAELRVENQELRTELARLTTTVQAMGKCSPCALEALAPETVAEQTLEFSLYPNPSAEYFVLQRKDGNVGEVVIRSIDATGRLVEERKTSTPSNRFDTSGYPDGTYLIEVLSPEGKQLHQQKVIVNH